MQIAIREADQTIILDVEGNVDLKHSPMMRKALLDNLKKSARVIVNLEKVPYIDSSGIASLVEGLKASQDLKNRLLLAGLSPMARKVLELTNLTKLFEIYENADQALNS
ncbi:MAG: STAS domain-containing protein [Deltaproteobacteria bacterium]